MPIQQLPVCVHGVAYVDPWNPDRRDADTFYRWLAARQLGLPVEDLVMRQE